MRLRSVDPAAIALACGIGVLSALMLFLALGKIARPAGFEHRAAAAGADLDHARSLMQGRIDPAAYSKGALCTGPAGPEGVRLKQRVLADAANLGIASPNLQIAVRRAGDDGWAGGSVGLKLETSGRYDALVLLLGRLSRSQPTLFADTVDLQSHVSSADLKMTGHIYCRSAQS